MARGGRPRVERISVLPETGLHPRSWTPLIRQIDADQADVALGPHAMPRLIEILLFLTPFVGFAVWRLVVPSERPPIWLVTGAAGFVLVMLALLIWLRARDASDSQQSYVPAQMLDGRIVPGHAATP
jgi:hypothetical protein